MPKPNCERNDFGFTDRQAQAMNMLLVYGSAKEAAAKLGIGPKPLHALWREAAKKMGAKNRMLALLKYQEFKLERLAKRRVNSVFDLGRLNGRDTDTDLTHSTSEGVAAVHGVHQQAAENVDG